MDEVIGVLGTQHREVLARLEEVESKMGGESVDGFAAYLSDEVAYHFRLEEEALFPILGRHLGTEAGPLAVMNAEHEEFRALLARLQSSMGAGQIGEQEACARELIELLRAHIAKEDGVLFPMAERLLSPTERAELASRAAAVEQSRRGGAA
jgi:hemerythrin-like domain-containing protein